MPRRLRLQDAGFLHHVISIGNNMQPIFKAHADFRQYLEFLDLARKKYPIKIYNFCLIDNHIHLLVEPKEEGALSRAMEDVSKSYAKYFNKKYNHSGHVFQGRFKSFIVEESKYFIACSRYMDMYPVDHKLVYEPKQYQWSGYLALAEGESPVIGLDLNTAYANLGATNMERQIAYRTLVFNYHGEPLDLLNRRAGILGDKEFKDRFKGR